MVCESPSGLALGRAGCRLAAVSHRPDGQGREDDVRGGASHRRGPQPAERAADADGSDGSETSVSGLHAAEQVREARAYVSGVEKRLKAVQRLFVQDVLGWVQPTLCWAEISDLVPAYLFTVQIRCML